MKQRLTTFVLLALVIALGGLVIGQRESRILDQWVGPARCAYDDERSAVISHVPLAVRTRGAVTWEIQARVYDRREPTRQPYVDTETVTFDTGGDVDRRTVTLSIGMRQRDWHRGFDDCTLSIRTAASR
jgi:hypothetical protein